MVALKVGLFTAWNLPVSIPCLTCRTARVPLGSPSYPERSRPGKGFGGAIQVFLVLSEIAAFGNNGILKSLSEFPSKPLEFRTTEFRIHI